VNDHLSKVAAVLGEEADAALYAQKAEAIRRATHDAYFKADTNSYVGGGQGYLAFALASGVTPEPLRTAVFENLARTITKTNTGHIDVGMHGSMLLLRLLTDSRRDDLAFLMMNQTTYPSWGYMREQGATTLWERWDGDRSQIHSTLLAAGEWFPRALGGIKPDPEQPGFRRIIIDPRPVGDITWANTWYDTIRGPVASNWKVDEATFTLDVEIPANTMALVRIPAAGADNISESDAPLASNTALRVAKEADGLVDLEVPSGTYHFVTLR
jgi:alpha-L-rhamnosidase